MGKFLYKVVTKDRISHPGRINKMSYPKESIVTAPDDSMGIFAFERKRQALNYVNSVKLINNIIIKLLPLAKVEKVYACPTDESYHLGYRTIPKILRIDKAFLDRRPGTPMLTHLPDGRQIQIWPTRPGTVVCKKVFVID